MNKNQLIMITGGGTGGHVYPALSVSELLEKEVQIEWIGSRKGIERLIIKERNIPYNAIFSGKLRRYFSLKNFLDLFAITWGFLQSLVLLLRKRPRALFSKGGFVSVPPVLAARILGIPVISHESDIDPGLATKINAASSQTICIPYEESKQFYPDKWQSRLLVSGNPIRPGFRLADREKGRRLLGISTETTVLLIVGGSLGALSINKMVGKILPELTKKMFVIHQTGKSWVPEECMLSDKNYLPLDFITDNYPELLAASDIVVSRGGAGSLWEIASLQKKAILIPLGLSASRGDQIRNARLFESWGLASVLDEETMTPENLKDEIDKMLRENHDKMMINFNKHFNFEADRVICEIIKKEAGIL